MGNANMKKLRSALESPDQEKEIKKLFNHYDKNKNGKIELFVCLFFFKKKEFEKFSDDVAKLVKADKDSKWDVDKLTQFSFIDTDKDSSVSYDELKAAILAVKH
jgi:Ca2+-binding EF-hand superfamily protein